MKAICLENSKDSFQLQSSGKFECQSYRGLESNPHLLSELLPYELGAKTHSRLIDGIKEYLLLLVAAEKSMKSLSLRRLKDFDPLVGENACQIRAVKLALIIRSGLFNIDQLSQAIEQAKNKVLDLLNSPAMLLSSGISLKDVLKSEQLDITINPSEAFLIKSYILTKVKILLPPNEERPLIKNERTDTKKIKEISEVGSMFAGDFVKFLREKMSATSVRFVQELAKDGFLAGAATQQLSDRYLVKHRGLDCLPCFATARVLMHQAVRYQLPIVMFVEQRAKDQNCTTVEKSALFFQATPEGYVRVEYSNMDPQAPALFFLGSTIGTNSGLLEKDSWIKELSEKGPVDLILAYAAAHRQYPNPSDEALLSEVKDLEYEYYKTKANEWGCSLENPSCFFLSHAFCDYVQNFQLHV